MKVMSLSYYLFYLCHLFHEETNVHVIEFMLFFSLVILSSFLLSFLISHRIVSVFCKLDFFSDSFDFYNVHQDKSSNNKCYVTFILFVNLGAAKRRS